LNENQKGLTLVELMAVLGIAVVLTVSIGFAWTRQDNSSSAGLLSQKLLVMMRQARSLAVESGGVVQVWIDSSGSELKLVQASLLGYPPPPGWLPVEIYKERAQQGATVRAAFNGVVSATNPTGGLAATITFRPDGSSTNDAESISGPPRSTTIFVADATSKYKHRTLIYGTTGFSRAVDNW
jgi:prepilin-type N-terminal cleavage/methylation domain-containing protein